MSNLLERAPRFKVIDMYLYHKQVQSLTNGKNKQRCAQNIVGYYLY